MAGSATLTTVASSPATNDPMIAARRARRLRSMSRRYCPPPMSAIRELLHPPAHRGPVIAAGAVVLSVGVALEQVRLRPGAGAQLLVVAALAVVLLWLGLQAR